MPEIDVLLGLSFCMYFFDNKQRKRAEAHIVNNREKLLKMWAKAVNGENPGKL
ncbi:hypothetical protein [Photobacterium aquimaris]|uniref:hypothetical protein n=1 Tax=Photobacterium aquimaris TaxID=512643 RepID=UPI000ABA65E1|nr:hypothetical protein [Photobacterium aquimaris]